MGCDDGMALVSGSTLRRGTGNNDTQTALILFVLTFLPLRAVSFRILPHLPCPQVCIQLSHMCHDVRSSMVSQRGRNCCSFRTSCVGPSTAQDRTGLSDADGLQMCLDAWSRSPVTHLWRESGSSNVEDWGMNLEGGGVADCSVAEGQVFQKSKQNTKYQERSTGRQTTLEISQYESQWPVPWPRGL